MRNLKRFFLKLKKDQVFKRGIITSFSRVKHQNLINKVSFQFSTLQSQNQNPLKKLNFEGSLHIRNSQTLSLKLLSYQEDIQILLNRNTTIKDLIVSFNEKFQTQNTKIVCHEGLQISQITPLQALLNRMFFILLQNSPPIKIEGQYLNSFKQKEDQSIQLLKNIQFPLITRRQIQQYFKRIDTWLQSKYGEGLQGNKANIPGKQVKSIVIQALRDRRNPVSVIQNIQDQYQKLYWDILNLKDKKEKALDYCNKMVRNRLMSGLVLLMANTGFIWSGTYLYFSWDIIEPLAYFISSFSGIILTAQFFKLKKPFTNLNYREYMINKYSSKAYKKFELNINELQQKQKKLQQLESIIKDYYLSRL